MKDFRYVVFERRYSKNIINVHINFDMHINRVSVSFETKGLKMVVIVITILTENIYDAKEEKDTVVRLEVFRALKLTLLKTLKALPIAC